MVTPKRALFIGAMFFLVHVAATINVSLLPVHSTTSCPSSTIDSFGISLEKNSFKSNSYFIRQSTAIWQTKRLLVIAKFRRTQRSCTLTFRPLLKLIFSIFGIIPSSKETKIINKFNYTTLSIRHYIYSNKISGKGMYKKIEQIHQ